MVACSGKGLNDLGLYYECNEIQDARYVIFELSEVPALVLAFCFPEECSIEDYWNIIDEFPHNSSDISYIQDIIENHKNSILRSRYLHDTQIEMSLTIVFPTDHTQNIINFTAGPILMLIFILLLSFLCLSATVFEICLNLPKKAPDLVSSLISENYLLSGDPEKLNAASFINSDKMHQRGRQIFLSFSLYTNLPRLLVTKTDDNKNTTDIFNAVKVLSILWVILGHTELYRLYDSVDINIDRVQTYSKKTVYSLMFSAPFAVDSFF